MGYHGRKDKTVDNLNQQPWYKINVDITNAVKSNFNYKQFVKRTSSFNLRVFDYTDIQTIFNSTWIDYMHSLGFIVCYGVMFVRDPKFDDWKHAHIDTFPDYSVNPDDTTPRPKVNYALNWVLSPDNDDAEMIWYSGDNVADSIIKGSDCSADNFYEIDRHIIGSQPTLVNSGIFHSVVGGSNDRYAISLRGILPGVSVTCSWEEAVKNFKPFIID